MDDVLLREYLTIVQELERSPTKAIISRLVLLVNKEYPPAMHTLSVCFEKGIGVEKNEKRAFEYCKAAADRGNCGALHNMGCNYLEGRNVERNPELALSYFNSAAQKGYVAAMHNSAYIVDMGIGVPVNGELALRRYTLAYENGYIKSANNIGIYFISGRHVKPDDRLAEQWFKKGAAKGDNHAVKNLTKIMELRRNGNSIPSSEIRKYVNIWLHDGII